MVDDDAVPASGAAFLSRIQACFAIRTAAVGPDGPLLDAARTSFCRLTEAVHELADRHAGEWPGAHHGGTHSIKVRVCVCWGGGA